MTQSVCFCFFLYSGRTGRVRHATLNMASLQWATRWTATSFSLPITVETLETLCVTTTTPTSALKTKTMTSVWTIAHIFAKVKTNTHHKRFCYCNELFDLTLLGFFHRWILVQLLHWLKSKWCVSPLWVTYQESRWHLLVWMARTKLLTETRGDEDPTTKLCTIKTWQNSIYVPAYH